MKHIKFGVLILLAITVALSLAVSNTTAVQGASLTVPSILSNNAVLQRNMPVPVFGTATSGTVVTVTFNGQSKNATTGSDGKWRVNLDPMTANTAPGNMIISGDGETITLTGLQVGEVWVCSGQSNMVKELSSVYEGPEAAADAMNHNIRLFREPSGGSPTGVVWTAADATTAGAFSAVCYFFGHNLSHNLQPANLPIGLIQAATVGTTIQEWCHYNGAAGGQYDTMVRPLQPYAIRGINWYQGESNSSDSDYKDYLIALIAEWRSDWGQGQTPFQMVQLHGSLNWANFREQQLQAWLSTSNTGMAVAVDLPSDGGKHPLTKRPIGDRLAMSARQLWYGDLSVESSGPLRDPVNSYVAGNQMVIAWTHLAGGLVTGSAYQPGGAPTPFYLAGSNGTYYAGSAQIVGNTVVVTSASVPNPVSVRYVWSYGFGNLYNTDGLPASPFEMTQTGPPIVMHVLDIWTTDSAGVAKTTFTRGETIYWHVSIVDQNGNPVSGATVTTQTTKPNGNTYTLSATTGTNGVANFSKKTIGNDPLGTWIIAVTNVTKSGATYDPGANVKSSTTFVLQ